MAAGVPGTSAAIIRALGPDDVTTMRALNTLFGEAFEDHDTYGRAPPTGAWLIDLLTGRDFIALVAERDGAIVGGLAAYQLRKFEQARSEIYIYDLAVAEAFRRQGIARALIIALKAIAAERGAWVIFVQADHVDPPAIALYESMGRREEVLHFDIDPADS